jgi:hypothetical protein
MSNIPHFIIIGAMKCATSSLHEQLAYQSGIFMTHLKEPNFFSDDENYHKGMDWYLSLFSQAKSDDLCGESSTHYTKLPTYPQTVNRLHQHFPDLKFIYVMRNPIERLVSQYIHEWSQRVITEDINQAIFSFPELIKYSLYSEQLEPYLVQFGTDKVLPVFFEKLLAEPQSELERICHFIGYQGTPKWNLDLEAQNVSQQRMRSSLWRDFLVEAPVLKQIRRLFIPKSFRNWVRSFWTMKQKPQLSSENMDYLKNIFNQDLAILSSWLDMELNCDNFKEQVQSKSEFFIKQ